MARTKNGRKIWTRADELRLAALARAGKATRTIARMLRVTEQAIRSKAMRLGVSLGGAR